MSALQDKSELNQTRGLVNVRSNMMFRPPLIYIFDLTVFWLIFFQRLKSLKKSLHNQSNIWIK